MNKLPRVLWVYSATLEKITADGTILISFQPATTNSIQPTFFQFDEQEGKDTGGTSQITINIVSARSGLTDAILNAVTGSDFILDNSRMASFTEKIVSRLDTMAIYYSFMDTGGTILLEIRAWLTSYQLPTVTLDVGTVVDRLWSNYIVAVEK